MFRDVCPPVRRRRAALPHAVLLLLAVCACAPTGSGDAPTYSEHVAPLLNAQCVGCHREGGIGGFRLDSYADAKAHAQRIKAATALRVMPPWGVQSDGSCQTFREARWLSDAELDTLARWADAGAPEGDVSKAPAPSGPGDSLGTGALELGMSTPYAPAPSAASEDDDYRCFLLEPGLQADRYITGYEVLPGNTELVHHVLVYSVNPQQTVGMGQDGKPITNRQVMEVLQQAAGTPGSWPCFGAAGDGVAVNGLTVTWAPGTSVTRYPEGTGLPLRQGHQLVMQVHYHLHHETDGTHGGEDVTRVRLALEESVPRPALALLPDGFLQSAFAGQPASLPAGQESASYAWSLGGEDLVRGVQALTGVRPSRFDLYGIFPHMHGLGRTLRASLDGGASDVCAAQVPRWDYNWQQFYFYEAPLPWAPEQVLRVTCTYDTRGRSTPVLPGLGTGDEMCLFGLYLVPVF